MDRREGRLGILLAMLAAGCGPGTGQSNGSDAGGSGTGASAGDTGGVSQSDTGGPPTSGGDTGVLTTLGDGGTKGTTGGTTTGGTTGGPPPPAPAGCDPYPPATGTIVMVTPDQAAQLPDIVASASTGTVLVLADGTYDVTTPLHFTTPGVTLRSQSGDPTTVVLDGGYTTGEVVLIETDQITIAEVTLQRAMWHPIHVTGASDHDITGTVIYGVHVIDPGQQGIKINASATTHYADHGEIACSQILMTDDGRPHVTDCYTGGIDAHLAAGWSVHDNHVEGFWCEQGLSEHAIHFWNYSRDTIVERNLIVDCARGVGFGLGENGNGTTRDYPDDPCPTSPFIGHYGGYIRNNMVWGGRPELFASEAGMDSGVALEQACNARVYYNTVVSLQDPFVSMEYRWIGTDAFISDNLVTQMIMRRDGATAALTGNLESQGLEHFVDPQAPDLHLLSSSTAIDAAAPLGPDTVTQDYDGDTRDDMPDVGADEYVQ